MFVKMDTLTLLVIFSIIGFIVTLGVTWFYSWKFGKYLGYTFIGPALIRISEISLLLLIYAGWRGKECKNCGFYHASHIVPDIQWHADFEPCKKFTKK